MSGKLQKLVQDMSLVKGNVNLMNEIIDQSNRDEALSETLEDMFRAMTQLEPKLINMIGRLDDEQAMNMVLLVNDDLHKTFDRYHALKAGRTPAKFVPGET